jgi:hypothetical protein
MWGAVGFGLLGLGLAVAGTRNLVPHAAGVLGLSVFVASVLVAGWFGLQARLEALAHRERLARYQMLVAVAAQLTSQPDEKLRELAAKGGPAGEAAAMVLEGRANKR